MNLISQEHVDDKIKKKNSATGRIRAFSFAFFPFFLLSYLGSAAYWSSMTSRHARVTWPKMAADTIPTILLTLSGTMFPRFHPLPPIVSLFILLPLLFSVRSKREKERKREREWERGARKYRDTQECWSTTERSVEQ